MNFPIWDLGGIGGGMLIAIIATIHVYVAHFAVGGGLFLVLTELKGYRENSPAVIDYTKKHSRFFMLLTMVFGGVTGVAIWFVIALVSPAGTSYLVHNFVFGWAAEWVFFLVEIVALLIYYYRFDTLRQRDHLTVGFIYFFSAWMSLVLITGIIGFMLTPGKFLETRSFWDGFFNPSFWPGVAFRTALAFMLAGVYGFLTATRIEAGEFREIMVRYCAKWVLFPFAFLLATSWWYLQVLPFESQSMILGKNPEIRIFLKAFLWTAPVLAIAAMLMAIKLPGKIKQPLAYVILLLGFVYMGSFEWMREAGRRPYVIQDIMYSNSILTSEEKQLNEQGILTSANWVKTRILTSDNQAEAGKELYRLQCMACHAINGPYNDIVPLTSKFTVFGMDAQLDGMGKLNTYMPKFVGTRQERWALATYIVNDLHKDEETAGAPAVPKTSPTDIPPFDEQASEYVLLAWSTRGMHSISDIDALLSFTIPGTDMDAVLIKRGDTPSIVTQNIRLEYALPKEFRNPAAEVDFWKNSAALMGKEIPANTGPEGFGTQGTMTLDGSVFKAKGIPVVPYASGTVQPYPVVTVQAFEGDGKEPIATTAVVLPASTELGCHTCHGGQWSKGDAGISRETAMDILKVHDRINHTTLLADAQAGKPKRCQSCHGDVKDGVEGRPEIPSLSAALHGWHANYLTNRGPETCYGCHPAAPAGTTAMFRDVHKSIGLDCTTCHGTLEDHALSLLFFEQNRGVAETTRLMKSLTPRKTANKADIKPRQAWMQQPDCLNCHVGFQQPSLPQVSAFNKWTEKEADLYRSRTDEAGIRCQACHGAPHAVYPAVNRFEANRDVLQPMQYQDNNLPIGANGNCKVCHTIDMEYPLHHENMMGPFRNTKLMSMRSK